MAKRKVERTRITTRTELIGAHVYDVLGKRCRYCHRTRKQILEHPDSCHAKAADKMERRTPLKLTAEDEQILREDWLLDPHDLKVVRLYQELLHMQRQNATLRERITKLETIEMGAQDDVNAVQFGHALEKRDEAPRIRRLSRQFNVWPASLAPGEVLLLTEVCNGVEYAFVARDEAAANDAMREMTRGPGLDQAFEWLMRETTKEPKG